jgi:hypothetical protein
MEATQVDMPKENQDPHEVEDSKAEFLNTIKNPQQHYDNVKMKYFATLGMNKSRDRTLTAPPTNAQPMSPSNPVIRRRSVSGPVRAERENGIPIPKTAYRHQREPSEDEPFFPMDSPSQSPTKEDDSPDELPHHHSRKFIPPHEMVQRDLDFQVGTARSLAVYETRRRNQMNIS